MTHYHPCDLASCDHGLSATDVVAHSNNTWRQQIRQQRGTWTCVHCHTPTAPGSTVCANCADIP